MIETTVVGPVEVRLPAPTAGMDKLIIGDSINTLAIPELGVTLQPGQAAVVVPKIAYIDGERRAAGGWELAEVAPLVSR